MIANAVDPASRSAARLAAVQALYQMETAGAGAEVVIREFLAHRLGAEIEGEALHDADHLLFADIVRGVAEIQRRVDPIVDSHLAANWRLERLDATARAILRCAVFELIRLNDIPAKVVIDEYVEVARAFFEDGPEPAFINGALDAAAREIRAREF